MATPHWEEAEPSVLKWVSMDPPRISIRHESPDVITQTQVFESTRYRVTLEDETTGCHNDRRHKESNYLGLRVNLSPVVMQQSGPRGSDSLSLREQGDSGRLQPRGGLSLYHMYNIQSPLSYWPLSTKLPEIFRNYFVMRERTHQINTRNKHNLYINIFKTSFGQKSIKVLAAHMF